MFIILTLVGIMVFLVSCFTVGFKPAFWRLIGFAVTGLIFDVLIGTFWFFWLYCQ